jgi:uncharacterized protein
MATRVQATARSTGDEAWLSAQPGSVALYFLLATVTAWTLWAVAAAIVPAESLDRSTRALLFLPGTFAPGLVALALCYRATGVTGVGRLLDRIFIWDVGLRWYLFAAAYMAAAKLMAAALYRLIEGAWPPMLPVPLLGMFGAVLLSVPFQAGEEIGWRGYALPRLTARLGLARASVLLGVVWALWHVPLFYIAGTDNFGQPFPVYLLAVTAISVPMAWLYVRTGGSLLLVMVMHAAINNTTGIVPAGVADPVPVMSLTATPMGWLTAIVLWLAAAILLLRMRAWQ